MKGRKVYHIESVVSILSLMQMKVTKRSPVAEFDVGVHDIDPLGHDHFAGVVLHRVHLNEYNAEKCHYHMSCHWLINRKHKNL